MKLFRLVVLAAVALLPNVTNANVIVSLQQSGSDLVASFSGSIDLTGASVGSTNTLAFANLDATLNMFKSFNANVTNYTFSTFTGPLSFGTGNALGTYGSGDSFGFMRDGDDGPQFLVWLPAGYVSGAALTGTATFASQTFSSMGISPGTSSWGVGNNTISITTNAVPEPSTYAMALVGLACGGYSMFRRRKRA